MRWLDRAHRLAPADANITLLLATSCLTHDDTRAETLFQGVATQHDSREAWLGLASARLRLGNAEGAAAALAGALSRHTVTDGMAALADTVVVNTNSPGWCGLSGSGVVMARPVDQDTPDMRLDGRPIHGALPPSAWAKGRWLTVTVGDQQLLGSPINIAAISRTEGCVDISADGVTGWAWHPGDPETDPILTVLDASKRPALRFIARAAMTDLAAHDGMSLPRGFQIPAQRLVGLTPPFHIRGRDGRDLLGSPLGSPVGRTVVAPVPHAADVAVRRGTTIVIPIHGQPEIEIACLNSVLTQLEANTQVIVVDDASPDPAFIAMLRMLAAQGRFKLLRNDRAVGFSASANAGIAACPDNDVVLLNSDTLVPPGWVRRLRDAAYQALDTGTVTPFSNHGGILSYPVPGHPNPVLTQPDTIRLDRFARRVNAGVMIAIPVGVGFCLFIKRACINATGPLRSDLFAQGYGAATDFCLRATAMSWRHTALPSLFVAHHAGAGFSAAVRYLRLRNKLMLNQLHPGFATQLRDFHAADPLAPARRRLDLARWRSVVQPALGSVLLITHNAGGGVEQRVAASVAAIRAEGRWPIVLRPTPDGSAVKVKPDGSAVMVSDGINDDYPNLGFRLPGGQGMLLRLLRAAMPTRIEVHHFLGHPAAIYGLIRALGVPYDVHIHDYAWFCPRISLMGPDNHYCGEPEIAGCQSCIATKGRLTTEDISLPALRRRSARFLAAANRVVTPSRDTATRIRRHFPDTRPVIEPHDDDGLLPPLISPPLISPPSGEARVCIVGGIGPHKGYDILLACARDAAARRLPLRFIVVGDTTGDEALLETGCAFITGTYHPEEAVSLIQAQKADLGFLPSVWPETWSLTLTELWRAGLRVAAFDLGAPAERISTTGRGFLLPFGLPPPAINNALLAVIHRTSHL